MIEAVIKASGLMIASVIAGLSASGGVDYNHTINLGAIMVAFLIIIVAGLFTLRNQLNTQQIEGWKGNYETMKVRADELDMELKEAIQVINEQKLIIQRLEALPNLERVVRLMSDSAQRLQDHTDELHHENLSIRSSQHEELLREIRKIPAP